MIKLRIEGKIPVVFFRDDAMIVAHSPALNLSTCGNTIKEAKKNFIEVLNIYLKDTIKNGTLEKDLMTLGWKSHPRTLSLIPPIEKYRNVPVHILKRTQISVPANIQ